MNTITRFSALTVAAIAVTTLSAANAAERGVSGSEVIFGMHTALSGPASPWGVGSSTGIRMRFDEINAEGGVHGRKLKLIVEDHQYQIPRAIQAANKLINRDKVFGMLGALGTPTNNAVLKQQFAKNVPNLFPFSGARSMHKPFHKMKFALYSDYYDQIRGAINYFVTTKGKKAVCGMYQDTDFGHETRDAMRDQAKAMGIKIVAEATHTPRDTDFIPQLSKLKKAGCDLVLFGSVIKDAIIPVATAKKMGWTDVTLVGNTASYDQYVAGAKGGITNGFYAASGYEYAYSDGESAKVKEWAGRYKAKFGKEPNGSAQMGYVTADLLIQGLQNAGRNLTLEKLLAGIEAIKDYRDVFGGPALSYGPDDHQGSTGSMLSVVENGKWKVVAQDLSY